MSVSHVHATMHGDRGLVTDEAAIAAPEEKAVEPISSDVPLFDDTVRAHLSERLNRLGESADPVAELESAIDAVADDLSRTEYSPGEREIAAERRGEIDSAIKALVGTALEMDDPVKGLEEGAESLAKALAARDTAAHEHARVVREQAADEQAAYRHARFHRVSELIDLGYGLDHALAITNANEAEIRARAAATGRNPMEPIYQYAVLNGYRPLRSDRPSPHGDRPAPQRAGGEGSMLRALSDLDEAAFAEVTKGDRWEALMR